MESKGHRRRKIPPTVIRLSQGSHLFLCRRRLELLPRFENLREEKRVGDRVGLLCRERMRRELR